MLGMGNIGTFVCNYCEARISQISRLLFPHYFLLKTDNKHVFSVCKNANNCYDKRRLSQYWMIIAPYNYFDLKIDYCQRKYHS